MLHIVIGAPCSGKTTYVQKHAAPDTLRIDYDQIAQTLGAATPHNAQGNIKTATHQARNTLIHHAFNNPTHETWIIHTNPTKTQLDAYLQTNPAIHLIDPGKQTCQQRATTDNRPPQTHENITNWYNNPPQIPNTPKAQALIWKTTHKQGRAYQT